MKEYIKNLESIKTLLKKNYMYNITNFEFREDFVKMNNLDIQLVYIHKLIIKLLKKLESQWIVRSYFIWLNRLDCWEVTRAKSCKSYILN